MTLHTLDTIAVTGVALFFIAGGVAAVILMIGLIPFGMSHPGNDACQGGGPDIPSDRPPPSNAPRPPRCTCRCQTCGRPR